MVAARPITMPSPPHSTLDGRLPAAERSHRTTPVVTAAAGTSLITALDQLTWSGEPATRSAAPAAQPQPPQPRPSAEVAAMVSRAPARTTRIPVPGSSLYVRNTGASRTEKPNG